MRRCAQDPCWLVNGGEVAAAGSGLGSPLPPFPIPVLPLTALSFLILNLRHFIRPLQSSIHSTFMLTPFLLFLRKPNPFLGSNSEAFESL